MGSRVAQATPLDRPAPAPLLLASEPQTAERRVGGVLWARSEPRSVRRAGRRREPRGSLVWAAALASADLPRPPRRLAVATIRSLLRDRVTLEVRLVDR